MKLYRITAIVFRHLMLTFRDLHRFIDLIYWPILDIVIWGFTSRWVQGNQAQPLQISFILLTALIFWQVLFRAQLEGELYNNVVHAFYKKYNLPHNAAWAQSGEIMLNYCQPSLDEITKRIRKKKSFDEDGDFLFEYEEEEYSNSLDSNKTQQESSITKNNEHVISPSKLLDLKFKIKF
jgi:hypothetical protein